MNRYRRQEINKLIIQIEEISDATEAIKSDAVITYLRICRILKGTRKLRKLSV